ncbi:MAG: MoaD/ThiS family protein [Halofilum sp. (in: g-proteobacteria)]
MQVTVKTFAHLRDRLGFAERVAEVADDARVCDVWRAVAEDGEMPRNVLAAVNLDYADTDARVHDGDEVAFFPPVTGG